MLSSTLDDEQGYFLISLATKRALFEITERLSLLIQNISTQKGKMDATFWSNTGLDLYPLPFYSLNFCLS